MKSLKLQTMARSWLHRVAFFFCMLIPPKSPLWPCAVLKPG